MEEQGHDPATYTFELSGDAKTPAKRSKRSESAVEPPDDADETPALEDMIVQDTAEEEESTENTEDNQEVAPLNSPKPDAKMDVDEGVKVSRKRESKDEPEATQAKKPCTDKDAKIEEKIENNTDAEDSINLDIGDDELLNEEVCFYVFKVTVTLPPSKANYSNGYSNGFMMEID